jgi:hypothetical protein
MLTTGAFGSNLATSVRLDNFTVLMMLDVVVLGSSNSRELTTPHSP